MKCHKAVYRHCLGTNSWEIYLQYYMPNFIRIGQISKTIWYDKNILPYFLRGYGVHDWQLISTWKIWEKRNSLVGTMLSTVSSSTTVSIDLFCTHVRFRGISVLLSQLSEKRFWNDVRHMQWLLYYVSDNRQFIRNICHFWEMKLVL